MDQQGDWTCGQGLAANATLPERLGQALAAMADVLEVHTEALDLDDERSKREHQAYRSLVQQQRQIASRLAAVAEEMAGYRDLPMGRHDMAAMTQPRVRETFAAFVQCKQELLTLLQETAETDQELLAQLRGS